MRWSWLGAQAQGFSGADLAALLREAGLDVLRQLKNREAVGGKGVYTEGGHPELFHICDGTSWSYLWLLELNFLFVLFESIDIWLLYFEWHGDMTAAIVRVWLC